jgi:hypothetical protein
MMWTRTKYPRQIAASAVKQYMDREIHKPGDLHGRTLSVNEVDLCWDGNQMCALAGPDLVMGVSGFGDSVIDALRELADNLVREAVWIELADRAELAFEPAVLTGGVIQTNVIGLYNKENRICAFAGTEDSDAGLLGLGTPFTRLCENSRITLSHKASGSR